MAWASNPTAQFGKPPQSNEGTYEHNSPRHWYIDACPLR